MLKKQITYIRRTIEDGTRQVRLQMSFTIQDLLMHIRRKIKEKEAKLKNE